MFTFGAPSRPVEILPCVRHSITRNLIGWHCWHTPITNQRTKLGGAYLTMKAALSTAPSNATTLPFFMNCVHIALVDHLHAPFIRFYHFDFIIHFPKTVWELLIHWGPKYRTCPEINKVAVFVKFGFWRFVADLNGEKSGIMGEKWEDDLPVIWGAICGVLCSAFSKITKNTHAKWNYRLYVGPQNILRYI